MVQLMSLPSQNPITSGPIKIQKGFTFLVPAYRVVHKKRPLNGWLFLNMMYSITSINSFTYFILIEIQNKKAAAKYLPSAVVKQKRSFGSDHPMLLSAVTSS